MGNSVSSRKKLQDSIDLLAREDVPRSDSEFWDELWRLPMTEEEVFELVSPADVRRLRRDKPSNLLTLVDTAVCQLCLVVQRPSPAYFGHALNCVRILTRTLPFLLEQPNDEWVAAVFWGKPDSGDEPLGQLATHAAMHLLFLPGFTVHGGAFDDVLRDATDAAAIGFVEVDAAAPQAGARASATQGSGGGSGDGDDESAGVAMLALRHPGAVWAPGVGVDEDLVARTSDFDKNRVEVLRLLLAFLCEPLFRPAELFDPRGSDHGPWSSAATASDAPFASLLFHSLLNTVLDFDPVGWGVPYGSAMSSAAELQHQLLSKAAQVLVVLLDFGANQDPEPSLSTPGDSATNTDPFGGGQPGPSAVELEAKARALAAAEAAKAKAAAAAALAAGASPASLKFAAAKAERLAALAAQVMAPPPPPEPMPKPVPNVFRSLLRSLGSDKGPDAGLGEYRALFDGLSRLLNNAHEAASTYLPGSVLEVECHQEVLVLLWKCLEENPGFMPFVLKHCDVCELVVPLCFFLFEGRKDPARVGLVHICTFILLKLSGERNFAVQLNKPFAVALPCVDFPLFTGSHVDLVVLVLHKLVVNGLDKLSPLYNCFLTIICNLSPYAKGLCLVASVKLVSLFELFTGHRFMYAAEGNHVYVALLLETFNNAIQYQYAGNPHLVYAIVRRRAVFEGLSALTLPQARAHAERQQQRAGGDDDSSGGGGVAAAAEASQASPGASGASEAVPTGRFVPNAAWLAAVKGELPLATILRLLAAVVPQIDELVRRSEGNIDDNAVTTFLANTTMVGLLPVPHPIVIRKYTPNRFTGLWFSAFLWGVVFLNNQAMPLFDGNAIRLFTVTVAPTPLDDGDDLP